MNSKSPKKSAEQQARAEKRRVAGIEGAVARAQVDADAIAIRKNMERLRALRLAQEAETVAVAKPIKKKAAESSKARRRSCLIFSQARRTADEAANGFVHVLYRATRYLSYAGSTRVSIIFKRWITGS